MWKATQMVMDDVTEWPGQIGLNHCLRFFSRSQDVKAFLFLYFENIYFSMERERGMIKVVCAGDGAYTAPRMNSFRYRLAISRTTIESKKKMKSFVTCTVICLFDRRVSRHLVRRSTAPVTMKKSKSASRSGRSGSIKWPRRSISSRRTRAVPTCSSDATTNPRFFSDYLSPVSTCVCNNQLIISYLSSDRAPMMTIPHPLER